MFGFVRRVTIRYAPPLLVSAVSAAVFVALQVPVGDLWAARARQFAAAHGAGITYWFGWFDGATPPAGYSLVSPYLSVLVGSAVLGAIATVVTVALCAFAVQDTPHPLAATWTATIVTGWDLWSGRIAFILGTAVAVGVVIAIRGDRWRAAAALALVASLCSPVVALFLLVGLSGVVVSERSRRRAAIAACVPAAAALIALAVMFGSPGDEPIMLSDVRLLVIALVAMAVARPPRFVLIPIVVCVASYLVLAAVPNAVGGNFHRMVWIWLPVAVIATARRATAPAAACVALAVWAGSTNSVHDLGVAFSPAAATAQYAPLLHAIDRLPHRAQYRVEVVSDGTHDAAYFLLGHAVIARGYETQTDLARNAILLESTLDAGTYQQWLDANAVGYVVLHKISRSLTYEAALVANGLPYLHRLWSNANWVLFAVADPVPVVAPPARAVSAGQSSLSVQLPRPGDVLVRVAWSSALGAAGPPGATARLSPAADGWTELTADRPGRYVLSG